MLLMVWLLKIIPLHAKELTIQAKVTTLCPCSKEISEYSAHNQRGIVTVKAYLDKNNDVIDDYKDKIFRRYGSQR